MCYLLKRLECAGKGLILSLTKGVANTNGGGSTLEGPASDRILFRNITQILDHLLKDYDSSQHPNYRFGKF